MSVLSKSLWWPLYYNWKKFHYELISAIIKSKCWKNFPLESRMSVSKVFSVMLYELFSEVNHPALFPFFTMKAENRLQPLEGIEDQKWGHKAICRHRSSISYLQVLAVDFSRLQKLLHVSGSIINNAVMAAKLLEDAQRCRFITRPYFCRSVSPQNVNRRPPKEISEIVVTNWENTTFFSSWGY